VSATRPCFDLLENDAELAAAFRTHIIHFTASRRMVTFFTDSGILPGTGFFSEWWRILGNRLLPGSARRAAPERLPARHL
jgi:site-specific recombinase